jgi:DNA polymerase-1
MEARGWHRKRAKVRQLEVAPKGCSEAQVAPIGTVLTAWCAQTNGNNPDGSGDESPDLVAPTSVSATKVNQTVQPSEPASDKAKATEVAPNQQINQGFSRGEENKGINTGLQVHARVGEPVQPAFFEAPLLGLDCEVGSDGQMRTVQLFDGTDWAVWDLREEPEVLDQLADYPGTLVAHNAAFEAAQFLKLGITFHDLRCTMLGMQLLDVEVRLDTAPPAERYGLAHLVERRFGVKLDKTLQAATNWDGELTDAHIEYAALDAVYAYRLWAEIISPEIVAPTATKEMHKALTVCADMHDRGFMLDREGHAVLVARYKAMAEEALDTIQGLPGFGDLAKEPTKANIRAWGEGHRHLRLIAAINSDKFLSDGLRPMVDDNLQLKMSWQVSDAGQLKFDKKAITKLLEVLPPDEPLAQFLQAKRQYVRATKLLSAFGETLVEKCDSEGRLHGTFNVAKAATGRMSCTSPNLQQMPNANEFRNLFRAPRGRQLIVADYTQIEIRVAGLLSGEPAVSEIFREGYDVHRAAASAMFKIPREQVTKEQRTKAKRLTFGQLYGMGLAALADSLSCTEEEAADYDLEWRRAFPVLAKWRDDEVERSRNRGYVEMGSGRRVKCQSTTKPSQLYNYPIQGTAADIQYAAMNKLYDLLYEGGVDGGLVAVVHDEIVCEVADAYVETTKGCMLKALEHGLLSVFPGADVQNLAGIAVGEDWSEKA